jgi:hypothetical protein
MKRFLPLVAFALYFSISAERAHAQLSIPGFGYLDSGSSQR